MTWSMLRTVVVVGLIGDMMSLCGTYSGQYTIMSHVLIFSNLGGVLIVVFSIIRGNFVHNLEIFGTVIALIGCTVTVLDGKAEKVD